MLVHEAYLRLVGGANPEQWNSRGHFFAAASVAIRRILIDNARRKRSQKRGGGFVRRELEENPPCLPEPQEDLLALDEALQKLAALDITDAAERAEYLSRTCAGDPTLRRQVETLLAAHERSGEFLNVPALQQMAAGASEDRNSLAETSAAQHDAKGEIDLSFLQSPTKPGSLGRLGHYEVQAVIGRGGCGIVLKAFDEMLHRAVAIKVMAPELASTSPARKRFLREARAAAAIRHENVVSILPMISKPASASQEPVPSARPKPEERPVYNRPPRPRSRRWVVAAAMLVVLLAGLGLTEATGVTNVRGTVIRLFSPGGTLVAMPS